MTPPPPAKCEVDGCEYSTDPSIPTYTDRRQELLLHVQMNHLAKQNSHEKNKSKKKKKKSSGKNKNSTSSDSEDEERSRFAARMERPRIEGPYSQSQWARIKHDWGSYIVACKLGKRESFFQLMACLEESLKQRIFDKYQGSLSKEKELLNAIEKLVCKKKSEVIVLMEFSKLNQRADEDIVDWVSRVEGAAEACPFSTECSKCSTLVSLKERFICAQILNGLSDGDWKEQTLSEHPDLVLDKVVKYLERLEAGRRARNGLEGKGSINAMTIKRKKDSSYIPKDKSHDEKKENEKKKY